MAQRKKLIRAGRVRVDGKRAKAADRMGVGAQITLPYQGEQAGGQAGLHSHGLESLKIYEDSSLLAINKPQGLAVQGGSKVQSHIAKMIEGSDLRLVHRLDRDTSGVLILAKGALNAKHLTHAFSDQSVSKSYLALVPQAPKDRGTLNLPLGKILIGGEGRMAIDPEGQEAVTDFEVLGRSLMDKTGACLLKLQPRTGRTHQLRVHCAHVFGGIFGDTKYGEANMRASSLRLHAWQLSLNAPLDTGEVLHLKAPLPDAFIKDMQRLDLNLPDIWSPA